MKDVYHAGVYLDWQLGPVLLPVLRDDIARLLANGSAAFIDSSPPGAT